MYVYNFICCIVLKKKLGGSSSSSDVHLDSSIMKRKNRLSLSKSPTYTSLSDRTPSPAPQNVSGMS